MNNIDQWELERQRAWVAFAMGYRFNGFNDDSEDASEFADEMLEEWQSRFPKPQEKSE